MEVYFYKNLRKLEAVAESVKILSKERKKCIQKLKKRKHLEY